MADETNDATDDLAHVKGVIASVVADAAKVKAFWKDYRLYIACTLCLIIGAIIGHKI